MWSRDYKKFRWIFFLLWICLWPALAPAQTIWDVSLNLQPFPSPYISEWESNPTAVGQATLFNRTNDSQEVVLFVTVFKSDKGQLVEAESGPLLVGPMGMRTVNNSEFIGFSSADYTNSGVKNLAFRTGRLPEGTYTGCVQVRNLSGANLSSRVCQEFQIVYPDPPQLISPMNGAEVITEFPTFQWIPVNVPAEYDIFYTFKVVEILGTQTPLRALEANVPLLERSDITATTLTYPIDALSFEEGKTYAWQVQALDQFGLAPASNQGRSEISTFEYRPAEEDTTEEVPEEDIVVRKREPAPGPCLDETTIIAPGGVATEGNFTVGEDLQIGKFVLTITTLTSSSGTDLSGEGVVYVPFFNADIRVLFDGLEVNGEGIVISGKVRSMIDPAAGVSASVADRLANGTDLTREELEGIQQIASQTERLISSFVVDEPVHLPIGYDRAVSGRQVVIGIYNMEFTPTTAMLHSGFQLELPELGPDLSLNFQQRANFHPNGLGDSVDMLLAEDFGYEREDTWSIIFKAPSLDSVPADSGTFVTWGCEGFRELRVRADVEFPRSWFKPDRDDGSSKTKASFVSHIRDGTGWMATANMERVKITGAPGFGMEVENMVMDFSDTENPEGIHFPETYEGITGPDWKGFYIETASLILPSKIQTFEGSPPEPSVNNLLIDDSGFTANLLVKNIIRGETGDFGGWAGSIDTLSIDMVSSSLREGNMYGGIRLPVSEDYLRYDASLNVVSEDGPDTENNLEYLFTISPTGTYTVPMWTADLQLYETSYISLVDTSETRGFEADANLNGAFTIDGAIGKASNKIPGVKFDSLEFQNLRFRNREPYASIGTWGFASPQKSLGGFPVTIDDIEPKLEFADDGNPLLGLGFQIEANLMGEAIAGSTYVSVYGKMDVMGEGPASAEFHSVNLERIGIHAELSALVIDGSIAFYSNDITFGNGFRGSLKATFLQEIVIQSTAQFGNVDGFRYWYVDALTRFPGGIPGFPSTSIYGFGGGAWYHMSRDGPDPTASPHEFDTVADSSSTPSGIAASGYEYVPDESVDLGLRAEITVGAQGDPTSYNADVSMSAEFADGGIRSIDLKGDIYVLANLTEREKARVTGRGLMSFDFERKKFTGIFDVDVDITPLTGGGRIDILFSPDAWHIKIGDPFAGPGKRINASIGWLSISGYFMVGNDLPGIPPPPPEAMAVLEEAGIVYEPPPRTEGKGIVLGAAATFDSGDQTFLIFYGRVAATLGFDFALQEITALDCGDEADVGGDFGANGLYAMGQVYAGLGAEIGIKIKLVFVTKKVTIFSAWVGAILQGGGPNPMWFSGQVSGKYNVLGIVKGRFNFRFKKGTVCTPVAKNPLLALDIISDIKPDSSKTDIPVDVNPEVAFNIAVNEPFELEQMISTEDSIYTKIRTFRIKVDDFSVRKPGESGKVSDRGYRIMENGTLARVYPRTLLEGEAEYEAKIEVFGEEYMPKYEAGPFAWDTTLDNEGNPVTEIEETRFKTGPRPDSILAEHVSYTYPLTRQRYFLQDENRTGVVNLNEGYDYLFDGTPDEEGFREVYVARFIPVFGGEEIEIEAQYNSSAARVEFEIPELQNSTKYAVQIVAKQVKIKTREEKFADLIGFSEEGNHTDPSINKSLREVYTSNLRRRLDMIYGADGIPDSLLVGTTLEERRRTIPGSDERLNEHLYYYFHFRTSRYNSLAQKMDAVRLDRVNYSSFFNLEDIELRFNIGEEFDRIDLYGFEYKNEVGRTSKIGPLVKVQASYRDGRWHRWYAIPFVYEPMQTLKRLGPFVKYERTYSRSGILPRWRKIKWRWNEEIYYNPVFNPGALAKYNSSGRQPLQDVELLPEPEITDDDSESPLNITSIGGELVVDESTGISGTVSSSDLGVGGGMFAGSSITTGITSEVTYEPKLRVKYRHPFKVLLDYSTAENESSYLMSEFRNRLTRSQQYMLNRAIWIDYIKFLPGRYRIEFFYNYGIGPDDSPRLYNKWFNYES